jgi:GWxTD domain-containing protein
MKRFGAYLAALLLTSAASLAQTLPELFQKAKAQVKGESWTEALRTLDTLEAEADRPGNEGLRQQLAAPTTFYRAVCEANLGQAEKARADFKTFLELEPNASMDPSMYSKKAIAAFDAARKGAAPAASPDAMPAMFTAFQEFRLPANAGERVNENWADGPVRWIMTAEEKRAWSQLTPGGEWQEFVDRFWEARNPRPGNPDNPYKTTFDRRVAFADANFVQAEGTRGSMTDRGMIFVLLGPPTYVGRKPIRAGEDVNAEVGMSTVGSRATAYAQRALNSAGEPAGASGMQATDALFGPGTRAPDSSPGWREIWHYRKPLLPGSVGYQQVDVDFVTRAGYGVNVLQRDYATLATLEAARSLRKEPSQP